MHNTDRDLQRYLDKELGAEENAMVKQHLAKCSNCQARLAEFQLLTTVLQSWTLPAGLNQLSRPLSLPVKELKSQGYPGLIGWTSGGVLVVLFVMARAIFWLSQQLNWAIGLTLLVGVNGYLGQILASLGRSALFRPWYLFFLGELGEEMTLILTLMVPILLYVVVMGAITVLFLNWFSLTVNVRQQTR
ncbi:MAG: zf-HC2 domain-containing protein [Anaerolineae bacterium]|nr:zf-HC2 domain-containing protein [Anaerolineae bacterium]